MAKQNNPQMSARKDTVTQITDINGDIIVEIGLHEYTVKHADGSRTYRRISETIQTVDGTVWSPVVMSRLPVGICEQCRRPSFFSRKTTGIVVLHRAKQCSDGCGQLLCPRHARLGRDKKWRCVSHHRTHLLTHFLKTLARFIFFEREGD
jgi:hypothetical protein